MELNLNQTTSTHVLLSIIKASELSYTFLPHCSSKLVCYIRLARIISCTELAPLAYCEFCHSLASFPTLLWVFPLSCEFPHSISLPTHLPSLLLHCPHYSLTACHSPCVPSCLHPFLLHLPRLKFCCSLQKKLLSFTYIALIKAISIS